MGSMNRLRGKNPPSLPCLMGAATALARGPSIHPRWRRQQLGRGAV